MDNRYLMIIPCSKRKCDCVGRTIAAIDLYDGPFYRIIRGVFRQKGYHKQLDVLIMSAKYGLIPSHENILYYEQRMTLNRARELSDSVTKTLISYLHRNHYKEIFINLGKSYMPALDKCINILKSENVVFAYGMIGERMQQLKIWINNLYNRLDNDTVG